MTDATEGLTARRPPRGPMLAGISNAMVRLYADVHGRGPTRAKTIWREDVVCVVLEDVHTPNERALIAAGHDEHVRETRRLLQQAMRERFAGAIAELTGRTVRAHLSQADADADVCVEVFLLHPED